MCVCIYICYAGKINRSNWTQHTGRRRRVLEVKMIYEVRGAPETGNPREENKYIYIYTLPPRMSLLTQSLLLLMHDKVPKQSHGAHSAYCPAETR